MADEPESQPDEAERKQAAVLSGREAISLISPDEAPADEPEPEVEQEPPPEPTT